MVKDYADQTEEVTVARARLGAAHLAAGNGGRVSKQRWTGPKVNNLGTVSLDGRFVPFVDPETGDLALHELATGTDRRLTTRGVDQAWVDFAQDTAISRDGAHIAYSWYVGTKGRYELRVATVNSGAESTPRIVLDNPDIGYMAPHDWSPDGRWIAVHVKRKDGTAQIGLVDAADGSLRVLKSVDWRGSIKMSVSPDGRFIAYDLPVGDARGQRDVFVLSVDSSREVPAYAHAGYDAVVGWSPDGRSLLVSSDRSGPMALWLLPMTDGRPAGPATLIEPDLGPFVQSLGLTRSGSLALS